MHTYESYAMINKTEILTALKKSYNFQCSEYLSAGKTWRRWEDNVKMDRTALRKGGHTMD